MFKFVFSSVKAGTYRCLVTALLLFPLLSAPCLAIAALSIDGRLDDPEWADAEVFRDFVVIDPLTLESPRLTTETRIISLPEGLAVSFLCDQPTGETRTRTITSRDARNFDSDSVSLLVDFDATDEVAYEFSVSITGSYRDGTITNETFFNYDWDAIWERAINETEDNWTVEILIPWSIVAMRENSGETRRMGVVFRRVFHADSQTYSFPVASPDRSRFISEFKKVEVANYTAQQFDVWPYVTVLTDLVKDSVKGNAGLDLFWKPSGKFQLAATINPDFGQVESDELVIDFSAIETMFSDKRPFFTENQGIYQHMMAMSNKIIYTRRIGGWSDDGRSSSDIEGAVKINGSSGSFDYGVIAAQEADTAGRDFYVGRLMLPKENMTLGLFSTYVNRPFIDRKAFVNVFDYDVKLSDIWRFHGDVIGSWINSNDKRTSGLGAAFGMTYTPVKDQQYMLVLTRYDDDLDFNDMGYMRRNSFEDVYMGIQITQDYPEDSSIATVHWTARTHARRNGDDVFLIPDFMIMRDQRMHNGSRIMTNIGYELEGYDDLESRGNGLVRLNDQLSGSISYRTPKRGAWSKSIGLNIFQEGHEDWGVGISAGATWYPRDNLTVDFSLNPRWSRDWLIWMRDTHFGKFSRRNVSSEIVSEWFPAENHEIRLHAQWLTINADAVQSYRIGTDDSRLVPSNDPLNSFAMVNFGFQLRYRYEIAPLSDFYVVYSRGGLENINEPSKSTLSLMSESMRVRNADQILIKLRYRF
ncbi:DUF5916 domain-containing protein [Deltaproteobacteria bacterium]|nr:DUF5916 domain-containing protein [Deltaproteobacteria bacterium]